MSDETTTLPMCPENASLEFTPNTVPIFIRKSNFYRVIHVDGVFGGGTPTPGYIMMTVFNHRIPLPTKQFNDAKGSEILSKREANYGIEQEYEASLVMSIETAKTVLSWLNNVIKNGEQLAEQLKKQQ